MSVTREQIMNAMLAHIQARCGALFAVYSRQFIMWEDLVQLIANNATSVPAFPTLFLYDGGLTSENWNVTGIGKPPVRTLKRHIVIYARRPGGGTPQGPDRSAAGQVLNPLIEGIEAAFTPGGAVNPDNVRDGVIQLGGLVRWARIEGPGDTIPGDIDPSGLMMQTIPVSIMMP